MRGQRAPGQGPQTDGINKDVTAESLNTPQTETTETAVARLEGIRDARFDLPANESSRVAAAQALQMHFGNAYVQRLMAPQAPANGPDHVPSGVSESIEAQRGGGQPMPGDVRESMEPILGQSVDDVRLHTDAMASGLADSLSARAFTTGRDVFFADGAYDPNSDAGRRTLAHELTHVVQGDAAPSNHDSLSSPEDASEVEASEVAETLSADTVMAPGDASAGVQREVEPAAAPVIPDQTANIAKLKTYRSNADARYNMAESYSSKALGVGDAVRETLGTLSGEYEKGYLAFSAVLGRAELEAENQQEWTDIAIGLALSVSAGVFAAWLTPATAEGAYFITLAELKTAAISSGAQALGGAGVQKAAGSDGAGTDLDGSGLDTAMLELGMWKKASEVYRSGLTLGKLQKEMHVATFTLGDLISEIQSFEAGKPTGLTAESIDQAVAAIGVADERLATLDEELTLKIRELDNLREAVDAIDVTAFSSDVMEKKIWQMWIADLPYGANVLDLDEIEEHLGPEGLGMLDFGSYTSDEEEERVREEMIIEMNEVERQQDKAAAAGATPLAGGLSDSITGGSVAPINNSEELPVEPPAWQGGMSEDTLEPGGSSEDASLPVPAPDVGLPYGGSSQDPSMYMPEEPAGGSSEDPSMEPGGSSEDPSQQVDYLADVDWDAIGPLP